MRTVLLSCLVIISLNESAFFARGFPSSANGTTLCGAITLVRDAVGRVLAPMKPGTADGRALAPTEPDTADGRVLAPMAPGTADGRVFAPTGPGTADGGQAEGFCRA